MVWFGAVPVSRGSEPYLREKDIVSRMLVKPQHLAAVDRSTLPVTCYATDYAAGSEIDSHAHRKHHQLIYAAHGVMVVRAQGGQWIVPPTRGIWMPAGVTHSIRCVGPVHMRSIYVRPDVAPRLSTESQAVGI